MYVLDTCPNVELRGTTRQIILVSDDLVDTKNAESTSFGRGLHGFYTDNDTVAWPNVKHLRKLRKLGAGE